VTASFTEKRELKHGRLGGYAKHREVKFALEPIATTHLVRFGMINMIWI
jgi:hypothetical protein